MVDEGRISMKPAVEISFMSQPHQCMLYKEMLVFNATPSITQSRALKQMSKDNTLTWDALEKILKEEKPNQRERFFMNHDEVAKYFPSDYGRSAFFVLSERQSRLWNILKPKRKV